MSDIGNIAIDKFEDDWVALDSASMSDIGNIAIDKFEDDWVALDSASNV